jgi:hypothetical protein
LPRACTRASNLSGRVSLAVLLVAMAESANIFVEGFVKSE